MKAIKALAFISALATILVAGDRLRASDSDAQRILGMESAADWTVENGTLVGLSSTRTQGASSLAVQAHGYTTVRSRLLGPLGTTTPQLSFDLRLPASQPNPDWFGAVQVFVSAPSAGLNNAYVGQRELTGLPVESFTTLAFDVPSAIRNVLNGTFFDVSFAIVLNVPSEQTGTYLVDNLSISSLIPGDSTIGPVEIPRILGFEDALDWQVSSSASRGSSTERITEGNVSLAVNAAGYTTITSLPMPSIAPVDPAVSFDLFLPVEQPNPYWYGATQLFVSAPSLGLNSYYLGQYDLTGLTTGQFHTFSFTLPADVRTKLDGSAYSDLSFTIVLNVPNSGTGIYYLDRFDVGPVSRPQQPPTGPFRHDLVGTASSGVATFTIEDDSFNAPVQQFLIYVMSVDGNCVPSSAQACRFIVPYLFVRLGSFSIGSAVFAQTIFQNGTPFAFTLGGSQPLTARLPSYVKLAGNINGNFGNVVIFPVPTGLKISVNPGGNGLITLSGTFTQHVNDVDVSVALSLTASTPLTNRMPLPDAGPDFTVTSSTCDVVVNLDGSASTDPDGNLQELRWTWEGATFGIGTTAQLRIRKAGPTLIRLVATDEFGGQAADEVVVTAQLGAGCP